MNMGGNVVLKDCDMRVLLIEELNRINSRHSYRIIEEMAVCDGNARVDVAVANGKLCGYEIKSDADTLERLAVQQRCYDKTFDKMSIVVGKKFEDKIEECIPNYWGIYIASECSIGRRIRKKRSAKINKNVEAASLLELLWKDEVVLLLKLAGIKGLSGKNRRILRQIAIDNLPFKEIKKFTRETIKNRKNWRD